MKRVIALAYATLAVATFAGCGGSTPAPDAAAPKAEAPKAPAAAPAAAKPAPMPAAASEAPPVEVKQPDTAVAPAPAGDPMAKLIGTTWNMPDGTELTFKDDKNAQAKGGKVAMLGPAGINVTYTFKDGNLEFSAMGTKLVGTWDGEKLTVSGAEGTKKAQ